LGGCSSLASRFIDQLHLDFLNLHQSFPFVRQEMIDLNEFSNSGAREYAPVQVRRSITAADLAHAAFLRGYVVHAPVSDDG
jgi:hypothetical protein